MGVRIFTETHASKIDPEGLETDSGFSIKANHVVIATNSPVNDLFLIHTKQSANRTYAIGARVRKGSIPKYLWWDTGDQELSDQPYHYARIQNLDEQYDLLIAGGEDHPVGNTREDNVPEEKRFAAIERWVNQYFTIEDVVYRWSGQITEPIDGLAYIGRNPIDSDNVYIVTGDSGNGLTHGTIAGMLIPDIILKKKNKWEKLYSPSRFKIFSAAGDFLRNNLQVMMEYFRDIPTREEIAKLGKLETDEGVVAEIDGEKVAAFRDPEGQLHLVSAVCTHLQCIVRWNDEEKRWDCPCHGSRFTVDGKVINGPANTDLPYRKLSGKKFNQLKSKK
jgi:Rieske Fe-S protein